MARYRAALLLAWFAAGCHDFDALAKTRDASDDTSNDVSNDVSEENVQDAALPRVKVTHITDSASLYTGTGDPFLELEEGAYLLATSGDGLGLLCRLVITPISCTPVVTLDLSIQKQTNKGPGIAVLHAASLTIRDRVTIQPIGDRPIAFLVRDDVTIDGVLSVNAGTPNAGAGGRNGQNESPCPDYDESMYVFVGVGRCGTAAFGTTGGSGGANRGSGGRGGGGTVFDDTPSIGSDWSKMLIGGGGGGLGLRSDDDDPMHQPVGGGGGGAVQITAGGSISLGMSGHITAVGGGGAVPESLKLPPISSGGGGGAGGTVFLEAPRIVLAGTIAVTGGGGAGGDDSASELAANGSPGSTTEEVSLGGYGTTGARAGGNGASASKRNGSNGGSNATYGGGGGGGGGRIVLKAVERVEDGPILVPDDCTERPDLETVVD